MESPSPPSDGSHPTEQQHTIGARSRRIRIGAWGALSLGLVLFLALGGLPAISYTYYSYSGRLVRNSPRRSFVEIWGDAVDALPAFTLNWLPGAVLIACLVVAVACAIAGGWLLLVQGGDEPATRSKRAG